MGLKHAASVFRRPPKGVSEGMDKVRVLVADSQGLVREGICALLKSCEDIEVVGEAGDGNDTIAAVDREDPEVVLLESALPVMDGAAVARRLRKENKKTRILFLGESADKDSVMRAIKSGGDGYVLKAASAVDLLSAIRIVHRGGYFLPPSLAKKLVEEYLSVGKGSRPNSYDRLSDREKEVLKLVAEGRNNREIAQLLSFPAEEIRRDRARLMKKLDIHRPAEVVRYALQKHLVKFEDVS
jgi:DNA-binding NarL/FixJ family response regulator